ncbi:DNA-directed RNA polymerase subunit A' [Candidatus Marsarchaeota archaeon]|jgi:DNA-directed RNA polymerase subunit A'|nr:DNA-directed RNA polymerase subunit A' [Candidatus Marsarchaeota archaeon]
MQAEMISHIKFTAISPELVKKMSVAKIIVPDTCNDEGYPIDGGLLDQRLGVIDPGLRCKTCGGKVKTCPGHFGHIELVRPTIHPEFARVIYLLLDATCESCHRILLNEKQVEGLRPDVESFIKEEDKQDESPLEIKEKMTMMKKLKSTKKCPYCGSEQHKLKYERPTFFYMNGNRLKADEIRDWLSKISNDDLSLLGIDGTVTRPEWFIITDLFVPPVNIRPSITLETGERSEDDLTHKLLDIIRTNQRLEQDIDGGAPQIIIDDLWELLQYQITTYFNNETAGVPVARHRSTRPLKTLAQRLKGKEGRLRYNLSGKRVNFAARTVVSADSNISINEVGIPKTIAENLTIPLYVTEWNKKEAMKFLSNTSYPTVFNYISKEKVRKRVTDVNREELMNLLKPGDILERQLIDGDIVLFNRQPTLHRISIMAHKVKVLPGNTFRMHPAVTIPYNADFDGDEMNIHVPQTLEAQAEAKYLMNVDDSILSPRDGSPVIFAEEDIITGIYMLTKDDAYFTKSQAARMLASVGIYELPKETKKGYSGKAIFSKILPSDLNISSGSQNKIVIKNGELVEGYIDTSMVERNGKIILEIFKNLGSDKAREFIDNVTKLSMAAIYISGNTISIRDYYLSETTRNEREKILNEAEERANELFKVYKNKTLELLPGCNLKKTYNIETFATLDIARSIAEKSLRKNTGMDNNAMLMVMIKSRGSMLSFVQTSMFLGQQAVGGGAPSRGYSNRVLPYFRKGDKNPKSHGFVKSSFLEGLDFVDYYMHAMGSRYSAMGKPLVTAISGYLQRRLINALQDLYVDEDYTVKDASNAIIEMIYGGDMIDPTKERLAEE